jgi:hypothetical protein
MAKPHASHALDWVEKGDSTASVLLVAQRLIAIETVIRAQLPASMHTGFAVAQIKGNELTLFAKHSALASKLRQLQPRLVQQIQAAGWAVDELKIKVATRAGAPTATRWPKQARALDNHDLNHFETLSERLDDGPLADAVKKLLARHRG